MSDSVPESVMVTGAAGFIGSHLSRMLVHAGRHVVGVDNLDPFYPAEIKRQNVADLPEDRFELIEADITTDAIREIFTRHRPDALFHLAALAGVRNSVKEPARYAHVNVTGLGRMLDAAAAAGCRRVVFASSSSVYGEGPSLPFVETCEPGITCSPYAQTKRDGEGLCFSAATRHGMAIAITRLFTVFGPAQRPDLAIARFMQLLEAEQPIPMFGDGGTGRDYTFVDDIVAGLAAAEQWTRRRAGSSARVFNLGSGRPITLREMIDAVSGVVGRRATTLHLPVPASDLTHTWADLARSRAELGYEPRVSFAEGLRRQWDARRAAAVDGELMETVS